MTKTTLQMKSKTLYRSRIFIYTLLISFMLFSKSIALVGTETHPNYLILLVHGVNNSSRVFAGNGENADDPKKHLENEPKEDAQFGDLKGYLEYKLGLRGYVYSYTFSDRDGKIDQQGHELGDRNYDNPAKAKSIIHYASGHPKEIYAPFTKISELNASGESTGKGNCWLEQAKIDFRKWYASQHPPMKAQDVPESFIPQKYILICHSMGGLAARSYIFSNYYQNDVETLITIDTPHAGSTTAYLLKQLEEFNNSGDRVTASAICLGLGFLASSRGLSPLDEYLYYSAIEGLVISDMIYRYVLQDMGWYYGQPAIKDLDPESAYLTNLNNFSKMKESATTLKVRLIIGSGVPTPPKGFFKYGKSILGLGAIEDLFSIGGWWEQIPTSGKVMALWLSIVLGSYIDESGDFFVTRRSQLAEGVQSLQDSKIDIKSFGVEFDETASGLKDAFASVLVMAEGMTFISGNNPLIRGSMIFLGVATLGGRMMVAKDGYLDAHGRIIKRIYEEGIIDKALEDYINLGCGGFKPSTSTPGYIRIFSANDISTPTAGYSAPDQSFALLSNKSKQGTVESNYHSVTIEAISESSNYYQAAPIYFDGQKKWVSGVMVKEAPTAIKGVINTFLPKKLKSFEYSENFAAWKPVPPVDEWGNFTVKDFNFAEGQNVIAFRAESWIGNKMNQILTITLNTIPMQPSDFTPKPNSYTNNNKPKFSVKFAKASYSAQSIETVEVTSAKLIDSDEKEIDILPQITTITGGGDYNKFLKAEFKPQEPLADGRYIIRITAKSNVGTAQAMWPVTIDTIPPTVIIN